jgi:hypothetical protein
MKTKNKTKGKEKRDWDHDPNHSTLAKQTQVPEIIPKPCHTFCNLFGYLFLG